MENDICQNPQDTYCGFSGSDEWLYRLLGRKVPQQPHPVRNRHLQIHRCFLETAPADTTFSGIPERLFYDLFRIRSNLTYYFGDNFTDTVEERYGLPARTFNSFHEAAIEAGLSRFYNGIHFTDAIDNGRKQGLQVGECVIDKVENTGTKAKPSGLATEEK